MTERFGNFIDGSWTDTGNGNYFQSINPADRRDVIGEFILSDVTDARTAINAAHAALAGWKTLSPFTRGEFLRKAADIMESRSEKVARAIVRENGKTLAEARGETARGVALLRYYGGEGLRTVGDVIPSVNSK